jgi:protein-tyrosine phosphatase/energy-coupling factor transporter ATP-binding protein EcfA2
MSPDCFVVEGGSISCPSGPILSDLDFAVPDRSVTVVLGPGGTGKTTLLRALSGRRLPDELRLAGLWRCQGLPRVRWGASDIVLVAQRRPPGHDWRHVFELGGRILLLDELCRGLSADEVEQLSERILAHRKHGAVVVVTHDLSFARRIADQVLLLCAGRIRASGPGPGFFDSPPGELAARFVKEGNCWPQPQLPRSFHWLRPGQVAGLGWPGLLTDENADLSALVNAGIGLLVSLTEKPFPRARLEPFGITSLHLPIVDMGVPEPERTGVLLDAVRAQVDQGTAVAFHCHAGLGRTGMMLAAYLVWTGTPAAEAVARVRGINRRFIQTDEQLAFVHRLESYRSPASRSA